MSNENPNTVPLDEILKTGKAPNEDPSSTPNATVGEANQMKGYMIAMMPGVVGGEVGDILINTTVPVGWQNAQLIPLQNVEPQPSNDEMLYLHLEIKSQAAGVKQYHVASWVRSVEINGIEAATRTFCTALDPEFNYLNVPSTQEGISDSLEEVYDDAEGYSDVEEQKKAKEEQKKEAEAAKKAAKDAAAKAKKEREDTKKKAKAEHGHRSTQTQNL
ncbi:MAG TPA: hypothetical protein VF077_06155 [Nitrospiraceae bacterium]